MANQSKTICIGIANKHSKNIKKFSQVKIYVNVYNVPNICQNAT